MSVFLKVHSFLLLLKTSFLGDPGLGGMRLDGELGASRAKRGRES